MNTNELISLAIGARKAAYAPYSKFAVGAALETASGKVFFGCNVENLSFGLTICAERNAVFAAIAGGEKQFTRIAIAADSTEPVTPCGACRQVLAEFAADLEVHSANLNGAVYSSTLSALLPRAKAGILNQPCST